MRFLLVLVILAGAVVALGYYALVGLGLIEDEACPAVSRSDPQIVVRNDLPVEIRVRVHDAIQNDLRVRADQCIVVDINRVKLAVQVWYLGGGSVPSCVTNMRPAQMLTLYQRGGEVYCDVASAERGE